MAYDKIVLVDWVDSATSRGWQQPNERDLGVLKIHSVGYLIEEADDRIVIVTSVSENDGFLDPLTIPKVAVINIQEVVNVIREVEQAGDGISGKSKAQSPIPWDGSRGSGPVV